MEVAAFDPSKIRNAEKGTFYPYEDPVLLSVDLNLEQKNAEKSNHFNQKYPTITFQLGQRIYYHRFQKFKEISSRKRFRGIPAVCVQCPFRISLSPIFTINMSDPRFCMVENWRIIAPTRIPKYPVHTCYSEERREMNDSVFKFAF